MVRHVDFSSRSKELPAIDLSKRRSSRSFSGDPVDRDDLGSILFAAQGQDAAGVDRLVPSAGRSYPLKVRVAARTVEGLPCGLYLYEPDRHRAAAIAADPATLAAIALAAFDAAWIAQASAVLLLSAEFERTTVPYAHQPPEGRAERYVWLEAGHAAQNIALTAAALSLATVFVGGFDDASVSEAFRLPAQERPVGLIPIGRTAA